MIVVSDTSPLILLAKIDCLSVLPKLYGAVVIPHEVADELRCDASNDPGCILPADQPWLWTQICEQPVVAPGIDWGESAALGLARELRAPLLIDDGRGRKMAARLGLSFLGSVGVLELAASEGLIQLDEAFARIKQTDFHISHEFLDQRLAIHQSKLGGNQSP